MTYQASEESVSDGKPVELYRYAGTYQTFRYTSGQRVVSYQAPDEDAAHDYTPIAMKRTAVNQVTPNDDNGDVTIDLPVSTDLVSIYGFQIAPPDLELTIFRGHNTGEFIRYWNGDVENVNVVKGTATLRIPSRLAAALAADFPNVYFQTPCNHTLFDPRCGILIADWSEATTISTVSGRNITVGSVGALDGKLVGGDALLPSGERRMIVSQTGTGIVINYPFANAAVSDALVLAAGCDLNWAGDCDTRYNNTARHGGYPFTPDVNIFSAGIEPGKNLVGDPCLPDCISYDGWDYEISLYRTWNVHDGISSVYMWPPPGGSGGNAIGGAIGSDFTTVFAPGTNFAWSARRINMGDPAQPVGPLNMDGVGNWNFYIDVGIVNFFGESPQNHLDMFIYMRHWTEVFPGPLVEQHLGWIDNGPFHNINVAINQTIDWRAHR